MRKFIQFSGVLAHCGNHEIHGPTGYFDQEATDEIVTKDELPDRVEKLQNLLTERHKKSGCNRTLNFKVLEHPCRKPLP